jgi:hypothetical protein
VSVKGLVRATGRPPGGTNGAQVINLTIRKIYVFRSTKGTARLIWLPRVEDTKNGTTFRSCLPSQKHHSSCGGFQNDIK